MWGNVMEQDLDDSKIHVHIEIEDSRKTEERKEQPATLTRDEVRRICHVIKKNSIPSLGEENVKKISELRNAVDEYETSKDPKTNIYRAWTHGIRIFIAAIATCVSCISMIKLFESCHQSCLEGFFKVLAIILLIAYLISGIYLLFDTVFSRFKATIWLTELFDNETKKKKSPIWILEIAILVALVVIMFVTFKLRITNCVTDDFMAQVCFALVGTLAVFVDLATWNEVFTQSKTELFNSLTLMLALLSLFISVWSIGQSDNSSRPVTMKQFYTFLRYMNSVV